MVLGEGHTETPRRLYTFPAPHNGYALKKRRMLRLIPVASSVSTLCLHCKLSNVRHVAELSCHSYSTVWIDIMVCDQSEKARISSWSRAVQSDSRIVSGPGPYSSADQSGYEVPPKLYTSTGMEGT
jgi:hypothetical protein